MNEASVVIRNACLVNIDPPKVDAGAIRINGNTITAVGPNIESRSGDDSIDVGGAVVMPGLVNGHTHLYSALAVGMPPPPQSPRNFHEILQYIWWRLDRALDLPLIETSAAIGAIEALRCGTTTVIDHHASPSAVAGSLDAIEQGVARAGLRGVLCYETTDRNGTPGRDAGLAENERYLKRCAQCNDHRFAALAGAHTAFTMSDESLVAIADLARQFNVGVHIHVAEDPCDASICRQQYGDDLLDRLDRAGILGLPSILAHGTHLTDRDISLINDSPIALAHNTRSNMNNAVGYAPLGKTSRPILLGTDGIGGDMFAELATAWFKSRDAHARLSPADCIAMLAASARRAGESLGIQLGKLTVGAAADVVLTDYIPTTPLTTDNLAGHLIFAMSARHIRSVMIAGRWRLRDRHIVDIDESILKKEAAGDASRLWKQMQRLD